MKMKKKWLCVFFTLLLVLSQAWAVYGMEEEDDPDKTLAPYFFVEGADPDPDSFPLKETKVSSQINGVIADTYVTQTYTNEGKTPINAKYIFPASTKASVHGMTMQIGNRLITARIKEKEEAREEFEEAKSQGKSASLLEQQRPKKRDLSQQGDGFNPEGVAELDLLHPLDHPCHKDGKGRRKHIKGRAADGLVSLHINGCISMEKGKCRPGGRGYEDGQKQLRLTAHPSPGQVQKQDPRKCPHGHDSLQGNVHNAAPLGEHTAQSHDHQRNGKQHGLLENKIDHTHACPPPFSRSLWIRLRMVFTISAKALK